MRSNKKATKDKNVLKRTSFVIGLNKHKDKNVFVYVPRPDINVRVSHSIMFAAPKKD